MNKNDRGVLYGMCLGDGCLHKQLTNKNYGLTIGHGPRQELWLKHKAEKLLSIFGGKPVNVNSYSSLNKTTNKVYTNLQLRKVDPYFNQIHKNLYPSGKKILTRKVLDFLTDEGLAYWFMDDGCGVVCKNNKGYFCGCMIRIATYVSREEADVIADWFHTKYQLTVKFDVDKRSNKVSVRFGTLDSQAFARIVAPYIIDSMFYKIESVLNYTPRVLDPVIAGEDIV